MRTAELLLTNLPCNASDRELHGWIESRGIETRSIRIIRHLPAGAAPASGRVRLKDDAEIQEAISLLDGKKMRTQIIRAM